VYDPVLEGLAVHFNICDDCFTKAGEQGRLFETRQARRVTVDFLGVVGWERVDRPYVPWHKGLPDDGDPERYIEDIFDPMWDDPPPRFHFNFPITQLREYVQSRRMREIIDHEDDPFTFDCPDCGKKVECSVSVDRRDQGSGCTWVRCANRYQHQYELDDVWRTVWEA
jgi:hypothetical protein